MISDLISDRVWAMEPAALETFAGLLVGANLDTLAPTAAVALKAAFPAAPLATQRVNVSGGVATIPIHGVIFKAVPPLLRLFSVAATGTDEVRVMIAAALDDPEVKRIHLDIHSPGGTVQGVQALAEDIRDAREKKQITAHAGDLMASSAYWIGSQASKLTAGAAAAVGSIGICVLITDRSEAAAEAGIKVHVVRSHPLKGIGSGLGDVTDEQLAETQRLVDSYTAIFVDAVAKGRGLTTEEVQKLATGQVWLGADAKKRKLVDKIAREPAAADDDQPEEEEPAPLGATTQQESEMDPNEKAELLARMTKLETKVQKSGEDRDQAVSAMHQVLMAQYRGRITPANKASVEEFAAFCGNDAERLKAHLESLPPASRPEQVGDGGAGQGSARANETNDPGEAKVEQMLGLAPGSIQAFEGVTAFDPNSRSFRRKDGSHFRIEEVK